LILSTTGSQSSILPKNVATATNRLPEVETLPHTVICPRRFASGVPREFATALIAPMTDYLMVCEQASRAGGQVLLDWVNRFSVREKGRFDLVTEADVASQETIRGIVLGAFPDHGFLGEEGGGVEPAGSGFRWIVDPLDGTTNYVHRVPQFAVSVALECRGELIAAAVYDPTADECYTAAAGQGAFLNGRPIQVSGVDRLEHALVAVSFPANIARNAADITAFIEVLLASQSVRRMGSAALNLAYVAAGRFDGCFATETKSWDVAAGWLLVREAGGIVADVDGQPANLGRARFCAASTKSLHRELLAALEVLTR
jgi:myo-inositol-1(or 4)-monophosphatase